MRPMFHVTCYVLLGYCHPRYVFFSFFAKLSLCGTWNTCCIPYGTESPYTDHNDGSRVWVGHILEVALASRRISCSCLYVCSCVRITQHRMGTHCRSFASKTLSNGSRYEGSPFRYGVHCISWCIHCRIFHSFSSAHRIHSSYLNPLCLDVILLLPGLILVLPLFD